MNRFDDLNITVDIPPTPAMPLAPSEPSDAAVPDPAQVGAELAATGLDPQWLMWAAVLLLGGAALGGFAHLLRSCRHSNG